MLPNVIPRTQKLPTLYMYCVYFLVIKIVCRGYKKSKKRLLRGIHYP